MYLCSNIDKNVKRTDEKGRLKTSATTPSVNCIF